MKSVVTTGWTHLHFLFYGIKHIIKSNYKAFTCLKKSLNEKQKVSLELVSTTKHIFGDIPKFD